MSTSTECIRCNGRMFMERYDEPCRDCKRNGASICGNCRVHVEWVCINCGSTRHEPVRRRKELEIKSAQGG